MLRACGKAGSQLIEIPAGRNAGTTDASVWVQQLFTHHSQEEYMKNFKMMTAALLAALLAFSTAGIAQQQQAAPTDVEVSDADLRSFAEARTAISEIQQDYSTRLQNADDPEKANELQQQANEEMIGAVEETGLDVDSFNTIAMAIQNDPELQQKLQQIDS